MRLIAILLLVACSSKGPPAKLAAWLERWEEARRCLVGSHGHGEDTTTATAIAALVNGPCRHEEGLRYPGIPDDRSGLIARWEAATEHVAQLQLTTAAERGAAIDAIDVEVAAIRAGLHLQAIERTTGTAIATLPAGRELIVGGSPFLAGKDRRLIQVSDQFAGGAVRGSTAAAAFLATSLDDVRTGPALPWHHATQNHTDQRAVLGWPSLTWSVQETDGGLSIGPPTGPRATVRIDGIVEAWFAIEDGLERVVLAQTMGPSPYAIAVSTDGGMSWRSVAAPEGVDVTGLGPPDPRTGGVDVLVRTLGYVYRHAWRPGSAWWRAVTKPGRIAYPELPDTPIPASWMQGRTSLTCTNAGVTWSVNDYEIVRIDDAGFTKLKLHHQTSPFGTDCHGNALVVKSAHPDRVERCGDAACEVVHEANHQRQGVVALLDDGRWIYAVVLDGIAGIWREGAAPAFYKLTAPAELRAITVLRGLPHLVLGDEGAPYRFIAVP